MKISIITATFNCEETIVNCLDSIQAQGYEGLEHIVVDGGSTDKTLELIRAHPREVDHLISEPDKGIYDALNKGVRLATGEVIGFLHSDDVFAENSIVREVMDVFQSSLVDVVYGDVCLYKRFSDAKPFRKWVSKNFEASLLETGWMPPHTSLFAKSDLYAKVGEFDTTYSISGDYDFVIRLFKNEGLKSHYIPHTLIKMKYGGASTKDFKSSIKKSLEDLEVLRKNKIRNPLSALMLKKLSKIGQYFSQ